MRVLRLLLPLVLPVTVVLLLGARSGAAGPDDAVRVPTRFVTHLEHLSQAGQRAPGDLVAEWGASGTLTLTRQAPPRCGWVPPDVPLVYGDLAVAGRTFLVALGAEDGDRAVLGLDLDGDRGLRGPGELLRDRTGRGGRSGGRPIVRWNLPKQTLGTLELDLSFRQLRRSQEALVLLESGRTALELTDAPPAGRAPVAAGGRVRYARFDSGRGEVALAFVRGEGERLTLFTDANGNGRFGEPSEIVPVPVGARDPGATIWQARGVALGPVSGDVAYRELDPQAELAWKAGSTGARRGTVDRGGTPYVLHLLDGDFDGTFTSAGDWWWFGPKTRLERFSRLLPDSMMPADQPFFVDAPWQLISVDPEGNAILVKDPNARAPDAYLHERTEQVNRERYFPVFAKDNRFAADRGIDTSRPRAASPPRWFHDVGVRATLERARSRGKPVLIDFEADWCNNCKRWDYHVYADREVASLLSRFELLKINVDFNFANDIQRFGGEGPPYLVFVTPDGGPLLQFPEVDAHQEPTGRQIPGLTYFQPPSDFVQTLRAALAAWQRRQGR